MLLEECPLPLSPIPQKGVPLMERGALQTSPLGDLPLIEGGAFHTAPLVEGPPRSGDRVFMERRGTGVAAPPPGSPDDHGSSGVPLLSMTSPPPQSCTIVPSREVVENIWKLRGVLTCPRDPLSPSPSPTTGEGHARWCPGNLDMGLGHGGSREAG